MKIEWEIGQRHLISNGSFGCDAEFIGFIEERCRGWDFKGKKHLIFKADTIMGNGRYILAEPYYTPISLSSNSCSIHLFHKIESDSIDGLIELMQKDYKFVTE